MSDDRAMLFESIKLEFLTVSDSVELAALAEQFPFMLDPDFTEAVERWLAEAEAAEGWDVAEGLRERLEVLRELTGQDMPAWRAALEAFAVARTSDDLAGLARDNPLVRDPAFHAIIEDLIVHAEQSNERDDAEALRLRLADLRKVVTDGGAGVTLAQLIEQMRAADPHAAAARTDDPALIEEVERQAMALLRNLRDQQQLMALIAQAPFVLDDQFLAQVEAAVAQAEASGDTESAGQMRARLKGLQLVKTQIQVTLPQTLEAFASVADSGELLALAQRAPYVLEESFSLAVERAIDELEHGGGRVEAEGLRVRLDALRQLRQQRDLADESPLMQALLNFLNAHDNETAGTIYAAQRELLDTEEAQQSLDTGFAGGDPESQQRIEERARLLQTLRTA